MAKQARGASQRAVATRAGVVKVDCEGEGAAAWWVASWWRGVNGSRQAGRGSVEEAWARARWRGYRWRGRGRGRHWRRGRDWVGRAEGSGSGAHNGGKRRWLLSAGGGDRCGGECGSGGGDKTKVAACVTALALRPLACSEPFSRTGVSTGPEDFVRAYQIDQSGTRFIVVQVALY